MCGGVFLLGITLCGQTCYSTYELVAGVDGFKTLRQQLSLLKKHDDQNSSTLVEIRDDS